MDNLNKILVIFDQDHNSQTAMLRAIELARLTKASIHLIASTFANLSFVNGELDIDTSSILRDGIQDRLNKELSDFIDTLDAEEITISYESFWSPHPHIEIAALCESEHFDLLIKTANHHSRFEGIFHTPLDWHLLRECVCPVLLVTEEEWPKDSPIIVAVDANSDDEAHKKLNGELLKTTNYFGQLLKEKVYTVNACPPLPVLVDIEYTSVDPSRYLSNMQEVSRHNLLEIIEPYNLDESNIKIADGIPEDVIPAIADQLDARLIVLGTVSRSGLKGYIMGNTAEQLLHNLHCDVLALKPEGFSV